MTQYSPARPGWYPDAETRGTKYWDGTRWTGHARPPRKFFAAKSGRRGWGVFVIIIASMMVLLSPLEFTDEGSPGDPFTNFLQVFIVGLAFVAFGIYLLRGEGPTTKAVQYQLAREQHRLALARQQRSRPDSYTVYHPNGDIVTVAQIEAISDPQTAESLQNLQNLLYTRTITDAEYQAAKDKLLGDF